MRKKCRICRALNVVLLGVVAVAAYVFVFGKTASVGSDGRTAIVVSADERTFVLGEMRVFLEAVQTITEDLAGQDMAAVAEAAHGVGMASTGGEPAALIAKLPLEFKSLGMATHRAFDDLGAEASGIGDPMVVLGQLGAILNNCTTCHAGYRFAVEGEDG